MNHEQFMRMAIEEGRRSLAEGGRAFACVLVNDEEEDVVASGHNQVLQEGDPTAHAELDLVREFCRSSGLMDLAGHTLYTNCEPCAMCSSAIAWCGVSTVVFGAGRDDGPTDYPRQVDLSCEEVTRRSGRKVEVIPHVLRKECAALFG